MFYNGRFTIGRCFFIIFPSLNFLVISICFIFWMNFRVILTNLSKSPLKLLAGTLLTFHSVLPVWQLFFFFFLAVGLFLSVLTNNKSFCSVDTNFSSVLQTPPISLIFTFPFVLILFLKTFIVCRFHFWSLPFVSIHLLFLFPFLSFAFLTFEICFYNTNLIFLQGQPLYFLLLM